MTTPTLSAIVAMASNRVIGNRNKLPWHLPADLKHFKAITTGHTIVMGRKTYESIGRPLPNRTNIILTRDANYHVAGCEISTDIEKTLQAHHAEPEVFIIGGAEIYKQLLPRITRIYLTLVHHDVVGDAYFPELNKQEWQETAREDHAADAENKYEYSFITLQKKPN